MLSWYVRGYILNPGQRIYPLQNSAHSNAITVVSNFMRPASLLLILQLIFIYICINHYSEMTFFHFEMHQSFCDRLLV